MTNKIAFNYNQDEYIITTIGQLNFFRWAIRNNIIDYVINDHLKINNEMNNINNNKKKYKINNSLENNKFEKTQEIKYKIDTFVNFGNCKRHCKVEVKQINTNNKLNIVKLQFEK